jgi:hypothetical protein
LGDEDKPWVQINVNRDKPPSTTPETPAAWEDVLDNGSGVSGLDRIELEM